MKASLLSELGSVARLHFVNTRLILTVGVDLNSGELDRAKVDTAISALQKMGFLQGERASNG